jgi:hypothetical protein
MFGAAFEVYCEVRKDVAPFATTHMQIWRTAEKYTGSGPQVIGARLRRRELIGQAVRDLGAEGLEYLRGKEATAVARTVPWEAVSL